MTPEIPDFLNNLLRDQYGPELTRQILDGYMQKRPVTLRANTLKTDSDSVRKALDAAGIQYAAVPWYEDAFLIKEAREPLIRQLPLYEKGEIYLQSLSSMIPALLLDPREKECILDMAAAPGGKTTQMAALSGGLAQITACEKNKVRSERLRYNLDKQGATKVLIMNQDARNLDPLFSFDKILLDAPCSGSGTLYFPPEEDKAETAAPPEREEPATSPAPSSVASTASKYFTRELIDRSVRTQEALLRKALELLKPGRIMIYSTCSILEAENEGLLKKVLSKRNARLVPIEHPMLESLPLLPTSLPGTCCIRPTEFYEGFFVAKIQKKSS